MNYGDDDDGDDSHDDVLMDAWTDQPIDRLPYTSTCPLVSVESLEQVPALIHRSVFIIIIIIIVISCQVESKSESVISISITNEHLNIWTYNRIITHHQINKKKIK